MASSTSSSCSKQRSAGGSRWGSPQRNMVWTEPKPKPNPRRKVAVVYYLCNRDGHLEHPHFLEMEPSPSPSPSPGGNSGGLYLRDFTDRLNTLRGNGMANMYSWSSKRSYKNGFVWHDLTEEDLIHPAHADEYVLKGSQLLLLPQGQESIRAGRRKNWSSLDLGDYKMMASSQHQQQPSSSNKDDEHEHEVVAIMDDEISPPPSSSSPEDSLVVVTKNKQPESQCCSNNNKVKLSGRMRASSVLMQLISCGANKNLLQQSTTPASSNGGAGMHMMAMERDYFSGSLVDTTTNKQATPPLNLKRSSSYTSAR